MVWHHQQLLIINDDIWMNRKVLVALTSSSLPSLAALRNCLISSLSLSSPAPSPPAEALDAMIPVQACNHGASDDVWREAWMGENAVHSPEEQCSHGEASLQARYGSPPLDGRGSQATRRSIVLQNGIGNRGPVLSCTRTPGDEPELSSS
jgi:hypothetical protein